MKGSGLGLIALLIVPALMPALGFRAPSSPVAAFQREPAQNTAPPIDEPVTFDVVITDAKARPVRDLQPGDVELSDAGEMHAIDTVRLHEGGGRMIGILLDEFHVRAGSSTLRARAALMHLVDAMLRADDLVAPVKPLDPLHAITFTQDRALRRQIIGTFEGHAGDYTPRSDFERNFMSRDPRTADATRAQVVSAALQSLARRLGEQQGRKALLFVSEGFRPPQPRAIVFAANRSRVSLYALDPDPEAADGESMLRSIAEQTGGVASINDADLNPVIAQAIADLDRYFVLTFRPLGPADGRFRPVEVRVKRPGVLARARSGYWAPDAKVAALAAKIAAERSVVPFKVSRSSPYIRPWIGMTRGS